jgi:hypothetical protein
VPANAARADGATEAPATPAAAAAAADPDFYRATPYDLEPLSLNAAPLLDGYLDDWPRDPAAWSHFDKDARHRFAILTGVHERMLYLLLEVHDEHPLFDVPGNNPLEPSTFGDRVWLGFEDSQGEQQQVFIAATAPGAVIARRIESGEYGRQIARLEPRIRGAWMPTPDGYRLELRVPLSLIGKGFGVLIDDRDTRGALPVSYGTLRPDDLHTIGHLILAAPQLNPYLAQFLQPGLRLAVTTPAGRVLARADALFVASSPYFTSRRVHLRPVIDATPGRSEFVLECSFQLGPQGKLISLALFPSPFVRRSMGVKGIYPSLPLFGRG